MSAFGVSEVDYGGEDVDSGVVEQLKTPEELNTAESSYCFIVGVTEYIRGAECHKHR